MTTIYRIENAQGRGAYEARSAGWTEILEERNLPEPSYRVPRDYDEDDPHPGPINDGLGTPSAAEHFGFGDVYQMKNWFFSRPTDLESMDALGFLVTEWETDFRYIRRGYRQVTFLRELATKTDTYRPLALPEKFPNVFAPVVPPEPAVPEAPAVSIGSVSLSHIWDAALREVAKPYRPVGTLKSMRSTTQIRPFKWDNYMDFTTFEEIPF